MIAYQIEINSGDPHPTAIVIHRSMPVALTPRHKVHMKILQQLADGAASTLPDSDDAHHTVELLYQPIAEQTCDEHGVVHTSAIDVDVSGNTFVSAILLLQKMRADVGAKKDGKTLTTVQFEEALQNLKTIFEDHFLLNKKLACDLRLKRDDETILALSLARRKNKSIPTSVEPSRSGSSRCLETGHSPLHCSGMEFLISLICGGAHRLYERGQVMMAAFHNLPDTHPTRSFVVLPSLHADRKSMRRNMQSG